MCEAKEKLLKKTVYIANRNTAVYNTLDAQYNKICIMQGNKSS